MSASRVLGLGVLFLLGSSISSCGGTSAPAANAGGAESADWRCLARTWKPYGLCARGHATCQAMWAQTSNNSKLACETPDEVWCFRPPNGPRRSGSYGCMPTSMDCAQARAVYRDRNVRPPRTCQVYPVRRESEPTRENVAVPTPNAPADLSIASLVSKCDGGDGNACFIAGDHLYEGEGVEMNHVRGAALEKRACELNVKDACVSVALHYVNGDGMPRAPERAFQMLLRGCDEDWPMACEALGQAFEGGWGTPKNGANALAAFRKACRLDPAHGCDALKGVTK